MCAMEENKQKLEFIEPEVKVVNIAPQSRILQDSPVDPEPTELDGLTIQGYEQVF